MNISSTKTLAIVVTGIVQGVGFRWATIQIANQLAISGWVKNEPDGSVKIIAQGDDDQLTRFIGQLKKPPTPYAKINAVESHYITNSPLKGFKVKY